jgi:hypothetical protein
VSRYTYDELKVVFEVLDREVVVINLDSGHYYVMDGSAAVIWRVIAGGADVDETTDILVSRYQESRARIEPAVREFVDELCRDDLIVAAGAADGPRSLGESERALTMPCGEVFEAPVVYKYTDMAALIQMDPIHEGWPGPRAFPHPRQG